MRIFGVMSVLSERRRFGKAFTTRRKLLSGEEGDAPNHQPPSIPPAEKYILVCCVFKVKCNYQTGRVLASHVFCAGSFSLFNTEIGDIEWRGVHVV